MAKESQKHLSKEHWKHGVIDQGKNIKYPLKENGHTESIMFKIILMFHTNMLIFIVIKINDQHYYFLVHIQILLEQGC